MNICMDFNPLTARECEPCFCKQLFLDILTFAETGDTVHLKNRSHVN